MPEILEQLQHNDPLDGDLGALLSKMRMQETLLTLVVEGADNVAPASKNKDAQS
jgi:hypothetical protein